MSEFYRSRYNILHQGGMLAEISDSLLWGRPRACVLGSTIYTSGSQAVHGSVVEEEVEITMSNLETIICYFGRRKRKEGIHVMTTDTESFFNINTSNWHHAVYIIYKGQYEFQQELETVYKTEKLQELNQCVIKLMESESTLTS